MQIYKEVYDYILNNVPNCPPEMGGILGREKEIICDVQLDYGINSDKLCSYEPNVEFLNKVIGNWQQKSIQFCGMFHTHFYGIKTLSDGDKEYIYSILTAMPKTVVKLFFPVVLPEQKVIVSYMAIRTKDGVIIEEDEVKIL